MCSYIRISSTEQNFDRQVENLSTVVNFFSDELSGKDKNILALEILLSQFLEIQR
jgi:hypothetical protein